MKRARASCWSVRVHSPACSSLQPHVSQFFCCLQVPKRALKMMGLKRVTNEAGEGELVEREGAQPREVNWSQVARVSCSESEMLTRAVLLMLSCGQNGGR